MAFICKAAPFRFRSLCEQPFVVAVKEQLQESRGKKQTFSSWGDVTSADMPIKSPNIDQLDA